ncbi:PREDICTED: phosphoethanolamine N-methyltransferase 3-like [Branchiostoma belcheri]|uniref:Phosphoethanolamine N-methyltransferase 3-like n=1 Tax=Branchiostoma belcheri TaxID=7741 RepID=A0A6P4ZZ76_BRABE|nr:PREDICTED: phosphoethanolamine N-methyltransferase 3-like [Branchiostoma belcheri]
MSEEDHKLRQRIRYRHVEKIYMDLKELGYHDNDPLEVTDLMTLDQWHYFGTEPVDAVIKLLDIREGARVLDVGAGIGGPSRYLAHKTKCHVTAAELLPDNHRVGQDLTSRCCMTGSVKHVCGDIIKTELGNQEFDHVMSIQAIYYVEDKSRLFRQLYDSLKPGGTICFEEFCRLKDVESNEEKAALDFFLLCVNTLPTQQDYRRLLEEAGFQVTVHDISAAYAEYTYGRWSNWDEQRDKYVRLYGEDMVDGWLNFIVTAKKLCNDFGLVGGGRFVARKL